MIFLSNDPLTASGECVHRGNGFRTGLLKNRSTELGYLRAEALVAEFIGLNSVFNFLAEHVPKPLAGQSSSKKGTGKFNFFPSYEKATDVYLKNPSSVRHFDEKDELLDGGEESGKAVEYDLTGDYIDIDRFIEGVPEVFGSMTNGNPRARRVTLVMNLSWWHAVNQEVINARCARAARLVDWLESQQIRVALRGIESTECGHFEIEIKSFDEPLDLNDIAVVSHSDFLRRIIFRLKEYSPSFESGYGGAYRFTESVSKEAFNPQYNTEYSIFVDSRVTKEAQVHSDFDDLEKWLTDSLTDDSLDATQRSIAILR